MDYPWFFRAYAIVILGELIFSGEGGSQVPDSTVLRDAGWLFFAVIFGFCAIKQPVLFMEGMRKSPGTMIPGDEESTARKKTKVGLEE